MNWRPDSSSWTQTWLSLQLAGLALIALLLTPELPLLFPLGALLMLLWRWLVGLGRLPALPRALRIVLALTAPLLTLGYFKTLLGPEAGVAFVLLLAGCKALETRTPRDATGLSLLGLFLVFALLLFDQGLVTVAAAVLLCGLFLTALAADQLPPQRRRLAPRLALKLMAISLPLMLAMFVAFPRIPGPLWRMPALKPQARTGVSATLSPGSVAQLVQSPAIAFRVDFGGVAPAQEALYWRGPVMSRFDGQTWHPETARPGNPAPVGGTLLHYRLLLEAQTQPWIYPLERPQAAPGRSVLLTTGELVADHPLQQRERFALTARLEAHLPADLSASEHAQLLALPREWAPRAQAWGQQLAARYPRPRDRLTAYLHALATQGYRYTLEPPSPGEDWVDGVLFTTRQGFCEHFAGASAVVLRAAGLPTRVIGGYLGGEFNPVGDYLIVRQLDAHAWIEVWLDGAWERVDPTAEVAPGRLGGGLTAALDDTQWPESLQPDAAWLHRLRLLWDNTQNQWNQWVIGYNEERRQNLLQRLSPNHLLHGMLLILGGGVLLMALLFWWRHRPSRTSDPVRREYDRLGRALARRQLAPRLGEGPQHYLARVAQQTSSDTVAQFAASYLRLRYGTPQAGDSVARLRHLRRQLLREYRHRPRPR